eukprot:SAG25_NODE_112_length_14924_cov_13.606476_13_plen_43_part_00
MFARLLLQQWLVTVLNLRSRPLLEQQRFIIVLTLRGWPLLEQ